MALGSTRARSATRTTEAPVRPSLTDLRLALRSLLRAPTLFVVGALTLALAIGLDTAIFGAVDAVVLRPLGGVRNDGLVALCERDAGEQGSWCGASVPDVYDIAARSRTLDALGAAREWPFMMRTRTGADGIAGGLATPDAFRAAGITPFVGRLIEPSDLGESWRRVVVLSWDFWQTRLGGRADVLGQALTLDDEPHVIVGILPKGAALPRLERVQAWRPIHFDPRSEERRDWRGFLAYGHVRAGTSLDAVRAEVAAFAREIQRDHFPTKAGWTIRADRWQDVVVGPVRNAMFVLLGAVGVLLLVGCVNVANLLLARATARRRDVAVRAALGASTAQLVRGVVAEGLVLALAGTAAGLLVGWWASRALVALAPQGIPRLDEIRLDARVFGYAALLAIATTLLVTAAPALRVARQDLRDVITDGGRVGSGRRAARTSAVLIVSEIALAMILATGAGLLGRNFATLAGWRPGFEQDHLLTTWVLASPGQFQDRRQIADYFARALDEVRTIPSVVSVGAGSAGPLFGGDGEGHLTIDGRPAPNGARQTAFWFDVSPGYFRTIGLPILRGRDIGPQDVVDAPQVAVVNETFVRRYFGATDPIGHRVHMDEHEADFTIVGVVADVPPVRPDESVAPQIFWSNRQLPRPATYILVRTTGDPATIAGALRARLKAFAPDMQVTQVRTMRDWLSRELVRPRFAAALLGTFGVVALALAAIGIYGLLAYVVAQQTRAIGIRVALGARRTAIVREVLANGLRLTGIAVLIGLAGALALTRLLASLLSGVAPTDPLTFGGAVVVMFAVTAIASVVPARRASRVDPVTAMRAE
jgi:predicted permease